MWHRVVSGGAISLMLATGVIGVCTSQEQGLTQIAGVDNSRMGAYRALAQLCFRAFQQHNYEMAAELARILERTWDKGEESDRSDSLYGRNRGIFRQIDSAMDSFINPILGYATKRPDSGAVTDAYNAFLSALKKGED